MSLRNRELLAALRARIAEQERRIVALESRNADLERYASTISHDLKSPLVTITGFLSFLRRDALAGDRERMEHDIERIHRAAEQMMSLLGTSELSTSRSRELG